MSKSQRPGICITWQYVQQILIMPDHQYTCGRLVPIHSHLLLNLFIQTYDYIGSLHEEWTFLLWSRWTKVKALYIITRYIPFFLVAADLYMIFAPNKDADAKCWMLMNIYSCLGVVSLTFSECIFILKTYALWDKVRIVLVAMLSALFAITVSFIGFWFATSDATTSTISGTVDCSWNMRILYFSMPFLPSFVFALGLFFLALIRVIQSWRTARGPLGAILVQHNMFYYACSLFLSAMNVLTPVLFSYVTANFLERFQVFILAILATRMHLHLWHNYWHAHHPDALTLLNYKMLSFIE
ncbi:hypothetical protein BDR06DRAFT_977909 [Suillus hirtellus]|nr:hypothetical protein BDR06DRAFT_977909 [Suillus hirtellus]